MAMLRRVRRRKSESTAEDRLSALPDDLIRVITNKLDTRTALATAALARRWARIPRERPALDLRVSDILPPHYSRSVALRQRHLPRDEATATMLDALMSRCESLAMTAFIHGVTNLIILPHHGRRRTKTLRLEFFQTSDGGCVNRLIAAAVGAWGVTDLEVVVLRSTPPAVYSFIVPDDNLKSRIRSLTMGKHSAFPPDLHSYGALTTLVLRDMPASTPHEAYPMLLNECPWLQVLHLKYCLCAEICSIVVFDAPCSQLGELVLEECSFLVIDLRDLPMLARLACRLTDTVRVEFGSLPSLMHTNLTFCLEDYSIVETKGNDKLDQFLSTSPAMTNLLIRFTGLRRWVVPKPPDKPLLHLKRLLVADLPLNWDVSWPRGLLMAAPSLEVLHIHVPHSEEPEPEYRYGSMLIRVWKLRPQLGHHHLKELVMLGFQQRHAVFLKYLVSVCTFLRRIVLCRDGHVRYNGLWDWEMVGQQACPWSVDDEMVVKTMINSGPNPLVQLILR
ncbi:uncharacterized protein LOC112269299 [Brachypodium distachyon]|uniref:At1g61320/AtMIF1 LRR domain-containing protein n=1 Tax=Brachypodium distachyon TaxID=15368 RepID=I1IWC3_BRADI|nr:uncharacterized protein LOC112269299 [Brachypodium distachyon]KQJ81890.1 hypothetical protein BRADI_5g03658v3 [Brachypodium distachyon]|eukprot:XP_024311538.1 uncharacterized protein LOC112269299 [Brachypodium distachyon]